MSGHHSPWRVFCCFITALSFTIVVPTVWITAAIRLRRVGRLDYFADSEFLNTNRSLVLVVKPVSADILHGIAVTQWSVEKDTCLHSNCTEVEIFFYTNPYTSDPRYDRGSYHGHLAPTVSNNFTWNATLSDSRRRRDAPNFATVLTLYTSNDYQDHSSGHSYENSLVYYSFDSYEAKISAFARDASTNESVTLKISSGSGFIVNFQFAIVPAGPRLEETDQIWDLNFSFKRNTVIIVYSLVITFAFWLITIMICLIMITTVVFGFRQRNEIVVVPIGTIFTFIQLRSSMPEAPPGFDFVGLLPCLILLSISAIAMVGIYLFANPDDASRRTLTWNGLVTVRGTGRRIPHDDEIPLVDTGSENPV
ncbi:hypothetical protein IW261DRAFT_1631978 [Armillaria novae-zelandiae]|uniref:Transmembrane protein n=1 Tax=Armillaria novae-zelandiae TaxID=153914 RepID=A0AA39P581_9AGAR|nr:hypothetical protein IW261DRAFT_1631978 [Armillaria novae-zelandiae]